MKTSVAPNSRSGSARVGWTSSGAEVTRMLWLKTPKTV